MKRILLSLLILLSLSPLVLAEDRRWTSGQLKLNLANIQDSLRIYEQSAINQSKEGAWRVATPEEKAVFCNADNSTQAFVYEGLDKEHSTWDCNYNMPQSFFSTSKLPQIACQVFNRYFIRFESPATLVCGEPVEENKLEKEKQKA